MTHEQAISTFASERYLLDEMTAPEREAFEEHYFSCAACAEDVRSGALMGDGVRAGLLKDRTSLAERAGSAGDRVLTFLPRPWYRSAMIPWAVAASLAIVVSYQTLVTVPTLRQLDEPLALAPITLRPASRGQEPRIPIAHDSAAIALAIDTSSTAASGVPANGLLYELRTAVGILVAAGKAEAPPSGAPLLLLVPTRVVTTGRYVLSVGGNEYPFEIVNDVAK
jgi:Putative zinc-finger